MDSAALCLCFFSYFTFCIWVTFALHASAAEINSHSHGHRPTRVESLALGSSLSPEKKTVMVSSDGTFSAGFYAVGENAYGFAIWYSYTPNLTVMWMANRDQPVNGRSSLFHLQKDGDLLLSDADGTVVWKTNTVALPVEKAELLSTGNLVLRGTSGNILWQSFDYPTDTLLPYQPFTKNTQLVSAAGAGSHKSGYYRLHFDDENVLTLIFDDLNVSSKYWPPPDKTKFDYGRSTYNASRIAVLDGSGIFFSSDQFNMTAWDYGEGPLRRLTLDSDGNLRLYSLQSLNQSWTVTGIAIPQQCDVHGLCGVYGVCTYTPKPQCKCPPGFEMVDSTNWFKGCRPIKELHCGRSSIKLLYLPHTDFYGFDNTQYDTNKALEECKRICMDNCYCLGFGYHAGTGKCYPKNLLLTGRQSPGKQNHFFVKISINDSSTTNSSSVLIRPDSLKCPKNVKIDSIALPSLAKKGDQKKRQLILPMASVVSSIGIAEILCIALAWWYIHRNDVDVVYHRRGYFAIPAGLKWFTFSELRRATSNFKDVVGRGGFGTVYKGRLLSDNKMVAVKRLEGVFQAEEEFRAEVSVISNVHHMNLVRMLGFCAEGMHRLLVYEYVENGSLDKYLFGDKSKDGEGSSRVLDWKKRFQIAVGTAKALAYLHDECMEWILHCDIKPQNILLDEQFCAKVSDFGLSKLVDRHRERALSFSTVRRTRGYMAPEWTINLPITAKADVYSFGIVLLELVSGRNAGEFNVSGVNFVQWAAENVNARTWVENVVDVKLTAENGDTDWRSEAERALRTALLCVKHDIELRPSMSQVVEMLTGADDIQSQRESLHDVGTCSTSQTYGENQDDSAEIKEESI